MFAPFGKIPPNSTAQWQPEPQVRGTFSIVSTCLLTMLLCVWTAVHLNIPAYKKPVKGCWRQIISYFKFGSQFYIQIGWLVTALFAPELVGCYPLPRNRFTSNSRLRSLGLPMSSEAMQPLIVPA
jgi:hypothetical protein